MCKEWIHLLTATGNWIPLFWSKKYLCQSKPTWSLEFFTSICAFKEPKTLWGFEGAGKSCWESRQTLEDRLFHADTWQEREELIGVNLCHARGERTGTTNPTKKGKLHWYEVCESRCQFKISLGTAWKETWVIYALATCSVEHKGEKAVGFPCHMPQDTLDSVTGHCPTFQCGSGDGDLWANTRPGDTAALLERLYSLYSQWGSFARWICQKQGIALSTWSLSCCVPHWRDFGSHSASFSWIPA